VKAVFDHPVIHRCQLHKIRNVESKLPKTLAKTVTKKMRAIYHYDDALRAEAELEELARQLLESHPGTAGSLRADSEPFRTPVPIEGAREITTRAQHVVVSESGGGALSCLCFVRHLAAVLAHRPPRLDGLDASPLPLSHSPLSVPSIRDPGCVSFVSDVLIDPSLPDLSSSNGCPRFG